jgi:hypothetical protein
MALASVPDAVNIISFGHALIAAAIIFRASSRCFFASRPNRWAEEGLEGTANNACMRAITSGYTGAVAL